MPLCNEKPHRKIKHPYHVPTITCDVDLKRQWMHVTHVQLDEGHLENEDTVGGCDQVCFAVIIGVKLLLL